MAFDISPDEYTRLIAAGVIEEDEPIELLEGKLVTRADRTPGEDCAVGLLHDALRALPEGWTVRLRCGVLLSQSVPEPDIAVVRGGDRQSRSVMSPYFAGPVRLPARGKCVMWGGAAKTVKWVSGWSHCGN